MYAMLKNYFKISFRNVLKYKGHSIINIIGLSIGIAVCLLLLLWVQDEVSYDRYHEKADRIYRVISQSEPDDKIVKSAHTPAPLAPALVNDFPWIKKAVRFAKVKFSVKCADKYFDEEIFFADPGVFDVFSFSMIKGNPKTAIKDPNTLLISEEMKTKYFGDENPVGKIISLGGRYDFKITGVFKTIPKNSHFRFHFLASVLHFRKHYHTQWDVENYWTYILIEKGAPIDTFREKMPQFITKYRGRKAIDLYKIMYFLQPLTSIHLFSNLDSEIEPNRDITTVYIFSLIALFILLIACLNYINLSTARFTNRAREVGLRKVLGALPGQLIRQFLGESFLLAAIALLLSMLLSQLFLPLFNSLSGKTLAFLYFENFFWLPVLFGIVFIVGLGAGIVPALFVSKFGPISALRGIFKSNPVISILRKALVVFQFSISIIFIIITLVIVGQLRFIKTTDLNLNKENVINIHINKSEAALLQYETIKYEFSKHPDVISVCASGFFPGKPKWNMNYWHDGVRPDEHININCIPVDHDFFETLQVNFVAGRCFARHITTDKNNFILNEAAVKEFGWKSALGKQFNVSNWKKGQVVGVVENFKYDSLHNDVKPVVLYINPPGFAYFSVRIKPHNIQGTIKHLKEKWQELVSGQTFEYTFLDEDFERLYKSEFRLEQIFLAVTIMGLFIACLGLFGLAAYTAEQQTKNTGIRKVFGASVFDITVLLSKEFTLWVLAANIFAWPVAWYAMKSWLQNFAHRVDITLFTFFLAGVLAFITALLTVSYKAVRAARANPVESLRYE